MSQQVRYPFSLVDPANSSSVYLVEPTAENLNIIADV